MVNGYRVSFPGVKRPGRGVDHPPLSSAEVKETVEVYSTPPLPGQSWPVLGCLPLPLHAWVRTQERFFLFPLRHQTSLVGTITRIINKHLIYPRFNLIQGYFIAL